MENQDKDFDLQIKSDMEFGVVEKYEAPMEKVFMACTDPHLIPQWWGPGNLTTKVDHLDARTGGTWRFLQYDADGKEYAFHGKYLEVIKPILLIETFEWEGMAGHTVRNTSVFEQDGDITILTIKSKFLSKDDMDGMLNTGMEMGMKESYERLTKLLDNMKQATK